MNQKKQTTFDFCLSIEDTLHASLFFDSVLPLTPDVFRYDSFELADLVIPSGLPQYFLDAYPVMLKNIQGDFDSLSKLSRKYLEYEKQGDLILQEETWASFENVLDRITKVITSIQKVCKSSPVTVNPFLLAMIESLNEYRVGTQEFEKESELIYDTTMSGLSLIDVSKLSVNQVIEIRKDFDSRTKLRRFRTFFTTQYDGKSKSFIEDDLGVRLHDYETTTKKWGLEKRQSSLSVLFDFRSIPSALGGLSAAFLGEPLITTAGISTAIAASTFSIGKVIVENKKINAKYRSLLSSSPIAYVAHLRELQQE